MEAPAVVDNECVKNLTDLVNELTPWYDHITDIMFKLESPTKSQQLKEEINNRTSIVNEIELAISIATDINKKVEGQYAHVRDAVNDALAAKTTEVTINATDKYYGGCTVSTEYAQAILDEMQDQKNKAEIMVDYIFHSYNEVLVPMFSDVFSPIDKTINLHCVEDANYVARKKAYDLVYKPMTKKTWELRGQHESDKHYKLRQWLRDNANVYASDTLQTFTDAMYEAAVNGDTITRNIIADNCYKSLTPAEYKWVLREVDVRRKKDSVDVYKISDRPAHFERVTRLLCYMLFGYGYENLTSFSTYENKLHNFVNDEIDIDDMKLLMAIPETCIFTFPTDEKGAYIQNVSVELIKHCTEYNQNWDLDAAYMYWFWTYLQGKEYVPVKDQEGVERPVPLTEKNERTGEMEAPKPYDYFSKTFKVKLNKILTAVAVRLYGDGGLFTDGAAASDGNYGFASLNLMAPWLRTFFPDNTTDMSNRNIYIDSLINTAKGITDVYRFIEWIHDTILLKIPLEVIKSFNAAGEAQPMYGTPIKFVPNNFSFFDAEYEYETAYLTILNSIYWTYGYISDPKGELYTKDNKPKYQSQLDYIYQGGLCYRLGTDPSIFSTERYDPFKLIWNPVYNGAVKYTRKITEPPKPDYELILVNGYWYYNWSSATYSYLVQQMGKNPRPIPVDQRIPFIGANCEMLPFKSFIVDVVLKEYDNLQSTSYDRTYNKNPWAFTFADYIIDMRSTGHSLLGLLLKRIIRRLLRCHISFPYNNILNMNFINSAHFMWYKNKLPENKNDDMWQNVILPQYIFTNGVPSKFENSVNIYTAASIPDKSIDDPIVLEAGDTIDVDMHQCGNAGLGKIDCAAIVPDSTTETSTTTTTS